ncbi:hypothetical protein F5X98DRAFT_380834 [Xylaria grammica]|nr:hypothetical protein F5X98DRAFT_380834 [Xylaria grammica]
MQESMRFLKQEIGLPAARKQASRRAGQQTDILKRTKGLADDARAYLRRKNASLFAMSSHLLQRGPRAGRGQPAAKRVRGIPEGHAAYVDRVENAAACARSVIQPLRSRSSPQNAARSPVEELGELQGKSEMVTPEKGACDLRDPALEGPSFNLDIFPADLGLLVAEAVLAAAEYAWAY